MYWNYCTINECMWLYMVKRDKAFWSRKEIVPFNEEQSEDKALSLFLLFIYIILFNQLEAKIGIWK